MYHHNPKKYRYPSNSSVSRRSTLPYWYEYGTSITVMRIITGITPGITLNPKRSLNEESGGTGYCKEPY